MSRKFISLILLAVLPLTVGLVVAVAGSLILPFYSQGEFSYDPAYVYLFNGIGLIRGFAPGHVDHPGTPLQLLAGVVTLADWSVRWLVGATTLNLEAAVLTDPEGYLVTISAVLLILNIVAVFYLGLKIARSSGSLAIAMLAQAGYLLFASQLPRFAYVSPEALAIFSAAIVMGLLSPYLFSPDPQRHVPNADPVLIGYFLALGLISKVTFLPVLALLLLVPRYRPKLLCLFSLLLFSVVLFGPALERFSQWLTFVRQIAGHSEYYGEGPAQFMDLSAVPQRMLAFWLALPALYVGFAAAGLVGAGQLLALRRPNQTFWQAGIFCAIIFLGLLAGIKHFGMRYAIPSLAIVPPVLAWTIFHFMKIVPGRRLGQAVAGAAVICVAVLSVPGVRTLFSNLALTNTYRDRDLPGLNAVIAQHPGALVIGAYNARTSGYAIGFGLYYVKVGYQKMLVAGRSNRVIFLGGNSLYLLGEGVRDAQLANELVERGREILMVLPTGIEPPAKLKVQLLHQIPDRERLFKVLKADS